MQEMLNYLLVLGITVFCNILCGVYYNVNIKQIKFDWYKLGNGIIKALIVVAVFIGLAFVFEKMPELADAIGVTPKFVMISAITLYTGKTILGLANILGVKIDIKGE